MKDSIGYYTLLFLAVLGLAATIFQFSWMIAGLAKTTLATLGG